MRIILSVLGLIIYFILLMIGENTYSKGQYYLNNAIILILYLLVIHIIDLIFYNLKSINFFFKILFSFLVIALYFLIYNFVLEPDMIVILSFINVSPFFVLMLIYYILKDNKNQKL